MPSYLEAINYAENKLKNKGIKSYHLDSIILLEEVLNKNRSYILAHQEENIGKVKFLTYRKMLRKRLLNKPIAQITNKKEFFGRIFFVNKNVLIPRPETEEIIVQFDELFKTRMINGKVRVCDLGTGSGVIGITAKLNHPEIDIDLVDLNKKALDVARINVVNSSTEVNIIRSNLLVNTPKDYDVVLANLPYVPSYVLLNNEAMNEPSFAIYSDNDGLFHYIEMFRQISFFHKKPLYLIIEFLDISIPSINKIAESYNYININRTGLVSTYKFRK